MSSNEKREHYLEWRAPLRGAAISSVAWVSDPTGPTFSAAAVVNGTRTNIDITAPAVSGDVTYKIRCKVVDATGRIHETEPPVELRVRPGGNF